jgi:hypothetical protein
VDIVGDVWCFPSRRRCLVMEVDNNEVCTFLRWTMVSTKRRQAFNWLA